MLLEMCYGYFRWNTVPATNDSCQTYIMAGRSRLFRL